MEVLNLFENTIFSIPKVQKELKAVNTKFDTLSKRNNDMREKVSKEINEKSATFQKNRKKREIILGLLIVNSNR